MSVDFDTLVKFLQAIVQVKTLSAEEKPVIDMVAAEMRRLGYDQVTIDDNGSVVGVIDGSQSGPTLLFDAHVDTVGISPGVPWRHDPFEAVIEEGRMYGRGTSDMKGALVAMIYAAAAVDRTKLAGRVVISASVMEEVMEGLALKTVMDAWQPDFVVIGESTDLRLSHGGRGRAEIHLEAIGKPSHSSAPHQGINAILMMLPAIQAIEAMPLPSDPLLGSAVWGLTDIVSEPYPGNSVIPSRCRATYDRRLLADETVDSVLGAVQQICQPLRVQATLGEGVYTTYTGAEMRGLKFFPAWKLDPQERFVQAALAGLRTADLDPDLSVYQFCTNAAYSAGVAGVPTVGFGPSPESMAHIVDEYLELADLRAITEGYKGIIETVLQA